LWPRRHGFAATIRSAAHPAVAADDAAPKPHPRKETPHPGQAMGSRDACRTRLRCWLGSGTVTGYGVASRWIGRRPGRPAVRTGPDRERNRGRVLRRAARIMGCPAALAEQTGAALMPVTLWYEGENWAAHIHQEIPVPETGIRQEKIAAMTQRLARVPEEGIARHPQDWHHAAEGGRGRPSHRRLRPAALIRIRQCRKRNEAPPAGLHLPDGQHIWNPCHAINFSGLGQLEVTADSPLSIVWRKSNSVQHRLSAKQHLPTLVIWPYDDTGTCGRRET